MRRTQHDSRDRRLRPQRGAAPLAARAKRTDDSGDGRRRRTAGNRNEDRYTARGADVVRGAAAIPTPAPLAPPALPVILNRIALPVILSGIATFCHPDEASNASGWKDLG